MPLLSPPRTLIELAVASRIANDTVIRQKARFLALHHDQDATGVCRATVTVLVSMYAADGEGFGAELVGPGFTPYEAVLVADNQTVVDAQTGQILVTRTTESGLDWYTRTNSFAQPVMLQGDFFEYLRENQAINIGEMIRHHIQQADAMGRFA